jgi:hypothetical protein
MSGPLFGMQGTEDKCQFCVTVLIMQRAKRDPVGWLL